VVVDDAEEEVSIVLEVEDVVEDFCGSSYSCAGTVFLGADEDVEVRSAGGT